MTEILRLPFTNALERREVQLYKEQLNTKRAENLLNKEAVANAKIVERVTHLLTHQESKEKERADRIQKEKELRLQQREEEIKRKSEQKLRQQKIEEERLEKIVQLETEIAKKNEEEVKLLLQEHSNKKLKLQQKVQDVKKEHHIRKTEQMEKILDQKTIQLDKDHRRDEKHQEMVLKQEKLDQDYIKRILQEKVEEANEKKQEEHSRIKNIKDFWKRVEQKRQELNNYNQSKENLELRRAEKQNEKWHHTHTMELHLIQEMKHGQAEQFKLLHDKIKNQKDARVFRSIYAQRREKELQNEDLERKRRMAFLEVEEKQVRSILQLKHNLNNPNPTGFKLASSPSSISVHFVKLQHAPKSTLTTEMKESKEEERIQKLKEREEEKKNLQKQMVQEMKSMEMALLNEKEKEREQFRLAAEEKKREAKLQQEAEAQKRKLLEEKRKQQIEAKEKERLQRLLDVQ